MNQTITRPDKFATWFNLKVPGAYRRITADDVRLLTECGLIGKYNYYGRLDLETVRGILRYEQLREKRLQRPAPDDAGEAPCCKGCGQTLSAESRVGRPKEYCAQCEPTRARLRSRKWRVSAKQKIKTETEVVYN